MPNIIGEPFLDYVNNQINDRQTVHGSKSRTSDQLAYLNSKTAWVKLASSVKIDGTFKSTDPEIKSGGWDALAKEYVLFSGFSSLNGSTLLPREKVFDKYSSKSFGLVPMPGIVDASVKCENRGSIKKATVNIKCYSPEQFRILEVLYLRLGYTVFLEFGWSSYLDGGTLKNTSSTLIETEFFNLQKGSKYVDFLKKIEEERKSKKGNYDGLLCKVSNFSWTFSQDGSYDIELSLITMGDVIESLKTNVKPSKGIVDLISEKYSLYGNEVAPTDAEAMDTNVPPAPAQDLISAYLFLQRVYVADKTTNPDYYSGKNDTGTTISGVAINVSNIFIKQGTGLKLKSSASDKDFLYFSYNDLENDEDVLNNEGFYIRFGHLINFIRDNIILKSKKSNEPIIEIDKDFETAKMYVFPYQVSLDPRVCIVGTKEWISKKAFYTNLPLWNDIKGFGANIANIYLNGAMVSRVLSEKKDEEGNISLYEMLNTICSELNRALGGVNNLETIIDEETMSIKIIDSSLPAIKPISSAKLELYGYNGNKSNFVYDFNIKTEITNDFATMVTIGATAGGYAKGTENTMFSKWNKGLVDIFKEDYIPPTQTGDEDPDPPNNVYASEFWMKRYAPFGLTYPQDIEDDITTDDACALSPEIIDKNIELVSEFYKYCQYKIQQDNQKYASPTNGFIPISLGITLEGISGIKIYNAVNVDTRFLPSNYPNNLNFIIKGVNHKISDGKWETNLETVVIAKSEKEGILKYSDIRAKVLKEIQAGVAASKANAVESTSHIQPDQSNLGPFNLESVTALITAAFQNTTTILNPLSPETPGGTGTQAEQESLAAAGSLLEQKTKEAAIAWFDKVGQTSGMCGKGSTGIAIRLGNLLTGQNNPYRSGNNAYSSTLRDNWNKIGIYKPESCTQPVFTNVTNSVIKKYIKDTQFNYGDGMVYFTNPPGVKIGGKAKYHAQIYTGDMYKSLGSVGWSTDGKKNYGSSFVYSSFDSSKAIWSMYHFRIKDEYKGKNVIPGRVNPTLTPVVNNGAMEMYLGYNLPKAQVTALKALSDKCYTLIGERITSAHIAKEIAEEGNYYPLASGFNSTATPFFKQFIAAAKKAARENKHDAKESEINWTQGNVEGGYRTYADQIAKFTGNLKRDKSIANRQRSSALVGFSQHHTGKASDMCSVENSWWEQRPKFTKWVKDNAPTYKLQVTYQGGGALRWGEPWHIYYTG